MLPHKMVVKNTTRTIVQSTNGAFVLLYPSVVVVVFFLALRIACLSLGDQAAFLEPLGWHEEGRYERE